MAILTADIKYYLSGGAGNTDPNLSLGGVRSTTTEVVDNVDNNLFDDVTGDEADIGDIEYRGIFVRNENATLTWTSIKFWVSQDTSSTDDEIDIAITGLGKNVAMETCVDEDTAPSPAVTFSHPTTKATGLSIVDLSPNDYFGIWFRRTVNASASAASGVNFKFTCEGDSPA
jgi:hypothetical protein